jgi:integrase/recombinase XerD
MSATLASASRQVHLRQHAPDFAIKTGTSINPSDTQNIHYSAARTAHLDASIVAPIRRLGARLSRALRTRRRSRPRSSRQAARPYVLGLLGLRIFEATSAEIADLGEEHGHRVPRVCGKGTKVVLIPLPPAVGRAIDKAMGNRARGLILCNCRGARVDRHAETRRLRRLAETTGVRITRPHPHMLRATWVTTMLDAGVDLRDVQIAARHADPRTTMRYDNSRVLHEAGEKPKVSSSAGRSRRLEGSLQAHQGRAGVVRLDSDARARYSEGSNTCCDMRSHVVSEYVKGGRLMPKT